MQNVDLLIETLSGLLKSSLLRALALTASAATEPFRQAIHNKVTTVSPLSRLDNLRLFWELTLTTSAFIVCTTVIASLAPLRHNDLVQLGGHDVFKVLVVCYAENHCHKTEKETLNATDI